MPHIDVPGASLYYEADGHASKPALLLIHAGIATLRTWDKQVAVLTADHYVIRFDTRGFGQTTTENVEYSDRADALAVLSHLGVQKATLIGASRGGGIAIDIAVDSPERVSGLVTIGSGPSGFPEVELSDAENALGDALDSAVEAEDWHLLARLETELWAFGPRREKNDLDPAFVRTAYELNRVNVVHAEEDPTALPLEPPAFDRVTDIEVPTLITVGEYDLTHHLAQYEFLLSTIPTASGCTFRDAAHLPNVEQTADFNRVLLNWLTENGL